MKQEIHLIASKEHFKIATEYNNKMNTEQSINKKTALMTVAAQNYFYAGVNAIEALLAAVAVHSFNHNNRNRNIAEHPNIFDTETYKLYNEIDRNIRNKVAYRGRNGKMYAKVKLFATKLMEKL